MHIDQVVAQVCKEPRRQIYSKLKSGEVVTQQVMLHVRRCIEDEVEDTVSVAVWVAFDYAMTQLGEEVQ
jgi:hypothetical protein